MIFGWFKKSFDLEGFTAGSIEALAIATAAHSKAWHFGQEERWTMNQDDGVIVFHFADGTTASAPAQVVGTYNSNNSSFLWGWDHPHVVPRLRKSSADLKAFGERHGLAELTTRKIHCSQQRAWELTALAMRVAKASGAYRGETSPGTFIFLTFGEVCLEGRKN